MGKRGVVDVDSVDLELEGRLEGPVLVVLEEMGAVDGLDEALVPFFLEDARLAAVGIGVVLVTLPGDIAFGRVGPAAVPFGPAADYLLEGGVSERFSISVAASFL